MDSELKLQRCNCCIFKASWTHEKDVGKSIYHFLGARNQSSGLGSGFIDPHIHSPTLLAHSLSCLLSCSNYLACSHSVPLSFSHSYTPTLILQLSCSHCILTYTLLVILFLKLFLDLIILPILFSHTPSHTFDHTLTSKTRSLCSFLLI